MAPRYRTACLARAVCFGLLVNLMWSGRVVTATHCHQRGTCREAADEASGALSKFAKSLLTREGGWQ